LLAANARARLAEKDAHCEAHRTGVYVYDHQRQQVRHRYTHQVVLPGNATHDKSPDNKI
jgi:hypothetical protein